MLFAVLFHGPDRPWLIVLFPRTGWMCPWGPCSPRPRRPIENTHPLPRGGLGLVFSCSVVSDSFVTPWTVARQAPLSMGFSRQEYWSGLPFPYPGDFPDPGIEPTSPASQADSLPLSPQGGTCSKPTHAQAPDWWPFLFLLPVGTPWSHKEHPTMAVSVHLPPRTWAEVEVDRGPVSGASGYAGVSVWALPSPSLL